MKRLLKLGLLAAMAAGCSTASTGGNATTGGSTASSGGSVTSSGSTTSASSNTSSGTTSSGGTTSGGARDAGDAGPDAGATDAGLDAGPDAGAHDAGLLDAGRDAGPDAGPDAGQCLLGATACESVSTLSTCTVGDTGATVWTESTCPTGSSCLDAGCVTSCVDACDLGATEVTDAGTLSCGLFDVGARTTVDAGSGMADEARLYNAYLRENGLPIGQVTYLEYAAANLATLTGYQDLGDSALFTGTYLAAEAWRYKATGSPDALANVAALVQTLHMLFNVSQCPGYLSRFAVPSTSPAILTSMFSSTDPTAHFDGGFDGGTYDWFGHISRDQYQGGLLGYSVAYDILTDESLRNLIRQDMVTFVDQLMITRSLCPTIDGVPCLFSISAQYTVVCAAEPLSITVTTSPFTETLTGIQEFMPVAFGVYPDPTVAIQLTSAFEVALQVTANQTAWASDYSTINTFFQANVNSWLTVAQAWLYSADCGNSYFANNIAFEPMFNLARLDQDPTRLATIDTILGLNMWSNGLINDKNVWFAYIFAADDPSNGDAPAAVTLGNTQLAQFGPAPRVHVPVTNSFPADPNCPGNALTAIDVGERTIGDFLWQRQPWQESDPGVPSEVFPGVDYMAAYWLGREAGFLTDDTPTQCTQWVP